MTLELNEDQIRELLVCCLSRRRTLLSLSDDLNPEVQSAVIREDNVIRDLKLTLQRMLSP